MLKRSMLMFGSWDCEEKIPFLLLFSEMYHVAVLLPLPRIFATCEMVLECQRILGEKSINVPRRHPVVFGFRFSFLCGLLCVLYRCWGTLLVCVLGLLFIFKGEAIFFVAKLSSNSSSSGDGYHDTIKVYILNFIKAENLILKGKKKSEKTYCSQLFENSKYVWLTDGLIQVKMLNFLH